MNRTIHLNLLKQTFTIFDPKGEGIDAMQLGSIMKSFGMPLDDLEISEMIREVGKKKDAKASAEKISFDSFCKLMLPVLEKMDNANDKKEGVLRATFNALDYQGVGYLTSSTLLRGLIGFFPDLTDEEVRVMIKNNTSGRNGNRITLEDLIDMFG